MAFFHQPSATCRESSRQVKIILAVHHFPPERTSGGEILAYRTARWLMAHGHQVHVVCVRANDTTAQSSSLGWSDEVYETIPVRRLSFNLPMAPSGLRLWFDHPELETHFENLVDEFRPDLVHLISGYLLGVAPLRAARLFGIPTIVTLTDFWFLCHTLQLLRGDNSLCAGPEPLECARCVFDGKRAFKWFDQSLPQVAEQFWRVLARVPLLGAAFELPSLVQALRERQKLLRQVLNSADMIVAPSRFIADIHSNNGIAMERIAIVPHSMAVSEQADDSMSHLDEVHIGFLGQVVPVKGVDILIRAFRQLNRSRRRARLTIHGSLQAAPAYVRELREIAHGDPDIVFANSYEHTVVGKILSNLDLVVIPSIWYENAPLVILEAFAAKRPIIGTNLGGIAEIVQHQVNGLLFERNNVADLARQMQRIIDEPDLLTRLRIGIPPVRTVDEEMSNLFGIYQKVLDKRQSATLGAVV
jgi:glycosyltransferase involved in cell wall biosynthesis